MKNVLQLVFLIFVTLFFAPAMSFAASLAFSPVSLSVSPGEVFTETVLVSSASQALNATSGTVTFPNNLLSVTSVSEANSILTLWVQQPTFSNYLGTLSWSGVVPNPGFTGTRGRVLSIRFVAKSTGVATIRFSSSEVLANDGNGTDILTAANPTSVSITSSTTHAAASQNNNSELLAQITSTTHPDQTMWYNLPRVVLDWTNAQNAVAVRLGYDQNANGVPTVQYDTLISHKELQLSDGIWYFHVQEKDLNGWGPVSTFRIQIDTVPPLPIVLKFPDGTTTATSTIAVQFSTTDALSGIDHYHLSIDGHGFDVSAQSGSSIYAVPSGNPGMHTLSVTAYDRAGNSVSAEAQFKTVGNRMHALSFESLTWLIVNYLSLALVIVGVFSVVALTGWYSWHRFRTLKNKVRNRLNPAYQVLHRQFAELNSAVVEEVLSLEMVRTQRELTKEEERIITNLRKVLERAEHTLAKEIGKVTSKAQEDTKP